MTVEIQSDKFWVFSEARYFSADVVHIHEVQGVAVENVGFVFFVVYEISSIVGAKLYKNFNQLSLKTMLIVSFVSQAILLALFTQINQLVLVILIWFIFELVSNITNIYASDKLNSSLFTDIGRRLSKFRVMIAVGGVLGQFVVSRIWDQLGMSMSFYFSSVVLVLLAILILFKNKQAFERN